ncbi:MAG: hypothetical protein JO104_04005 [Candidatus Eremiobacteraeota bacterium]|nr:hypothetical protein [Candidatus Eremiobacteraeota bacterium]
MLAAHDEILRKAVSKRDGIVFKEIGDAFCCAFQDPKDALLAAIDSQRELQTRQWPTALGTALLSKLSLCW